MTVISGHLSWVELLAAVVWMFGMRLTVIQETDEMRAILGAAVQMSLTQARLTVKEAAALMKMPEPNLRHVLNGDPGYHVSLNRLLRLPFLFWLHFSPSLVYLAAKKNVTEIAKDMGMRRSA